jgi:hypothetical protein
MYVYVTYLDCVCVLLVVGHRTFTARCVQIFKPLSFNFDIYEICKSFSSYSDFRKVRKHLGEFSLELEYYTFPVFDNA